MKLIPYTLLKRKTLADLRKKIETLQSQIYAAQSFIKEIEKGNLAIELQLDNNAGTEEDVLAASLLSMREQMSKIADEEKKRNWATEGLAKFVDILRSKNDDLKGLGDAIISNIVKYMNANQGSLFILNDEDPDDVHLEMIACYAYNRKKHLSQKIGIGQGLVGQAVLEKDTVYMTNIPDNYLKITSGLGEALPKNLMIVPLIVNEKVYGVIELASFYTFESHHREFIEKLAESIASTISNTKVNQQTRKLLEDTQEQAEQMRSQEEEMRQNMEELTATQEEMQRVLREVQGKEGYITQLLNVTRDAVFTVDREYRLVTWNKSFEEIMQRFGLRLQKGASTLDWYQGEEREGHRQVCDRALGGETFEFTQSSDLNGTTKYFYSLYAPLQNEQGEVFEAAAFVKDVTALMEAQKKAEKLATEAQHQTEELKAQEEELRQNMEELSATQEEMQRVMKEMESRSAYVNQLLNVYSDSIFTIDREYKLVTWNNAFAVIFEKYGMKLAKGLSTLDWYQGEKREDQKKLYDRAFGGESFEFTMSSELDGVENHHLSVYAPLRDEEGHVFEVAVFAKDVTAMINAQKKAEAERNNAQELMKEVQEKEAYLNALLNASKDSIFTIDKDYKLLSCNEGFRAGVSGLGLNVEKGLDILELFPEPQQKEKQIGYFKRAFAGEIFEVTNKYEYPGLGITYYTSSFSPLRNEAGEIYAVALFGKDVTEVMTAKEKAETLAAESKEINEEMKAQEEVLRQNLEELSASQEEMQRVMSALEKKEKYATQLLDASDDMVFTIDRDYRLVSWNKAFAASLAAYGTVLEKGMNTLDWYPEKKQRSEQKKKYDRVLAGEAYEDVIESAINDQKYFFRNSCKPLKNEKGEVYEAVIFARDVTAVELAKTGNAKSK